LPFSAVITCSQWDSLKLDSWWFRNFDSYSDLFWPLCSP